MERLHKIKNGALQVIQLTSNFPRMVVNKIKMTREIGRKSSCHIHVVVKKLIGEIFAPPPPLPHPPK